MSAHCCDDDHEHDQHMSAAYRRVLWIALAINGALFVGEMLAGLTAGSVALQADALDFLADSANYAISLLVIGMALSWRARAAMLKGISMGVFGLLVAGSTLWHAVTQTVPEAPVMGAVGVVALIANVTVAVLLFRYREGDANMRSVWICSRNDAVGNVAVLLAALGVFGTGTAWPDIVVGAVMAVLALHGALQVIRQAWGEMHEDGLHVPAE